MTYRREEFRAWFQAQGKAPNTVGTHISVLNGADKAFGLDELLQKLGTDGFLDWIKTETNGPFERYPANTKSALRRYVEYSIDSQSDESMLMESEEDVSSEPLVFQLEREMQAAVRAQIGELEAGLVIEDDGNETIVATGKIDILARDENGKLVAIELKAGKCPSSALEQVLGYSDALAEERGEPVRSYLVAGSFTDRTRAAARRTLDLALRTYEFQMKFNKPAESMPQRPA